MPQLEKLARLAGARFVLRELAHERTVRPGAALNLRMTWANVGVGRLQRRYILRLFLFDAGGRLGCTADAADDPREWLPGDHEITAALPLPARLTAGDYRLALALVDPAGQQRPFRLAVDAPESEGRREVSQVRVE